MEDLCIQFKTGELTGTMTDKLQGAVEAAIDAKPKLYVCSIPDDFERVRVFGDDLAISEVDEVLSVCAENSRIDLPGVTVEDCLENFKEGLSGEELIAFLQ